MPTVSMMEWQFILPLKILIRNKASRFGRLEDSVLKFKELKIKS
jgi:sporulation protein YlmC with PRC-barrel domain